MFKKILFIAIIILFTINLHSETTIFSSLGLGDIKPNNFMKIGVGMNDSLSFNNKNFATWAKSANVSYGTSFIYYYNQIKNNDNSLNYDHFAVNGFDFVLPISRKGHAIGISLSPYALSDIMNISEREKLTSSFSNEQDIYKQTVETKIGSINKANFIYAGSYKNLSFSSSFGSTFGSINKTIQYIFYNESENPSFTIPQIYYNYFETKIFVTDLNLGLYYSGDNFSLGSSLEFPLSQKASKIKKYNNQQQLESDYPDIKWPSSFSFGAVYYLPSDFKIASDFEFITMSDLDIGENELYEDYYKITSKIYYRKKYRLTLPFYQKIGYNLGFTHNNRGVKDPINQNSIIENSFLAGILIPYNYNRSSLELDFAFTKSGNINDNNYEDYIYKFQLSLNNAGNWWLRKKEF